MRAIDQALVDRVWEEIVASPPDRQADEARAFLEGQPHAAAFCAALTRELDLPARRAALGLAFLLFKTLEASRGTPAPRVSRQRIEAAYRATSAWLDRWEGADARVFLRSVEVGPEFPQPHLVQYLLTAFYVGDPNSAAYDEEVRASLFLLLKTLADAAA
jgi:hypothetical protein